MWELANHLLVTKGQGQSLYKLNSFDNALLSASIANYNHSIQSSIIPPGCTVHFASTLQLLPPEGSILPTILSCKYGLKGEDICAGLAFGINNDLNLPGLVYEYHGATDHEVDAVLTAMINQAGAARGWTFKNVRIVTNSMTVTQFHGCVLVAAVLLP
jgi:pyruvoyl-dependent arginine decarboxylase